MRHDVTRDAANRQQSARLWRRFVGVKLRAYNRSHSVGANQDVPFNGAAIGKLHVNALGVSGESHCWRVEIDGSKVDGVEQCAVQDGTEDADRVLVKQRTYRSDVEAAQNGSVRTPHLSAGRDEPTVPNRFVKSQLGQRVHGVGSQK
jgi:hypothetical protein